MSSSSTGPRTPRGLDMKGSSEGIPMKVAVRIRPQRESESQSLKIVHCHEKKVILEMPLKQGGARTYGVDRVFGCYSSQEQVFDEIARPAVDEVLKGFHSTIFAYGQTGSGKTHTMEGGSGDEAGIIPRSVEALFEEVQGEDATVRVSCLEIYNEELQDLLQPRTSILSAAKDQPKTSFSGGGATTSSLRLVEAQDGTVVVKDLEEVLCETKEACLAAVSRGQKGRRVAATLCNERSSRSHCVVTLKICVRKVANDGREHVVNGQLNLVDLAGSECVGRSGARDKRAREAGQINQSLLTLGRVITTLTSSGESKYVPYRDSKLTRLLKDSLGGGTKTTLIATVSPSKDNADETMSTLQYAQRARSILNAPTQHSQYFGTSVLKGISGEVDELARLLRMQRDKNGGLLIPNEKYDSMVSEIESGKRDFAELKEAFEKSNDENKKLKSMHFELQDQFQQMTLLKCDFESKLEHERMTHLGTKFVESTFQENEISNLKIGESLRSNFKLAINDLDSVSQHLADRLLDLKNDASTIKNLSSESSLSKEHLRKELSELLLKIDGFVAFSEKDVLQKLAQTSKTFSDDMSKKTEDILSTFSDFCVSNAQKRQQNVDNDFNPRLSAFTKEKAESLNILKEQLKRTSAVERATDLDFERRVTETRKNVLHNATQNVTEEISKKETILKTTQSTLEKDLNQALVLEDESQKARSDFKREESDVFESFEKKQREWLDRAQKNLMDFMSREFSEASRHLESCCSSRAQILEKATSDSQLRDTSRRKNLCELQKERAPLLRQQTTQSFKDIDTFTKDQLQEAFVHCPSPSDFNSAVERRQKTAVENATNLNDISEKLKTESADFCLLMTNEAQRNLQEVTVFAETEKTKRIDDLEIDRTNFAKNIHEATLAFDTAKQCLSTKHIHEKHIIDLADKTHENLRALADDLDKRPVPEQPTPRNHTKALDDGLFQATAQRDTLLADFYAKHAKEKNKLQENDDDDEAGDQKENSSSSSISSSTSTKTTHSSSLLLTPLNDASNRALIDQPPPPPPHHHNNNI